MDSFRVFAFRQPEMQAERGKGVTTGIRGLLGVETAPLRIAVGQI